MVVVHYSYPTRRRYRGRDGRTRWVYVEYHMNKLRCMSFVCSCACLTSPRCSGDMSRNRRNARPVRNEPLAYLRWTLPSYRSPCGACALFYYLSLLSLWGMEDAVSTSPILYLYLPAQRSLRMRYPSPAASRHRSSPTYLRSTPCPHAFFFAFQHPNFLGCCFFIRFVRCPHWWL